MNEAAFLKLISGETHGPLALLARCGLRPLSWGYAAAVFARNRLFDLGLKKTHKATVPVISVGNITTGGTGKTPVVAYLANWFTERNINVVMLSRGYRSIDGEANDEKLVLDQLCPSVPHLQNPDRVQSAGVACEEHHAQLLLLDDGFQHRRLARDCDVVLIDATNPWGYGAVLPRGLLRESRRSLKRAEVVMLTRVDQVTPTERDTIIAEIQRFCSLPIIEVVFPPTQLRNAAGKTCSLGELKSQTTGAFCGIGNPEGFFQSTKTLCESVAVQQIFADHHHYTADELESLNKSGQESNIDCWLTTQKDLVKINQTHLGSQPLWALEIGAEIRSGQTDLDAVLTALLQDI